MKQVIGSLVSQVLRDILAAQFLARSDVNTVLRPDTDEAVQLALLAGNVDVFIVEEIPGKDTFGKLKKLLKDNVTIIGIGNPASPQAPKLCYRPSELEQLEDLSLIHISEPTRPY